MWRTFDVGAVVQSLLDDAVVVAGIEGLNRPVSRAKIVTTDEELRGAEPNDLIVTSAETFVAGHGNWDEFVAEIDDGGVAAVVVRLNATHPLPEGLLDAANRAEVPFITFPADTALANVANAVLDALLEAQGRRLERVLDIHQRFTPIVLAGGGPREIAEALHSILGCPIAVIANNGHAPVIVPNDAAAERDLATALGEREPIVAGGHEYGEIIALTDDGELDVDGKLALQRASLAIAVRLAQTSAAAAEQERFAVTSLESLISGNTADIADVVERAASFGWDLLRPRAVLLASIDPWIDRRHFAKALPAIAAAARATLGPTAIVWARTATIAALVAPESVEPAERRRIAERLRKELDERVTSVTVSIGVGRCVDDAAELPRSYTEASRAVDVGRWAKGRHVTEVFDELGLERLLASTPAEDLAGFVEHAIGKLIEHDRIQGTELVETLGKWLETRNMAEASRQLFVHYNTFKNRLDRIEAIVGPVVVDGARSLELAVAVYVFRHYDGPWTAER